MAVLNSLANISSSFIIKSSFTAGTGTYSIANPGRAFRIVQILGTGLNTSAITVRKNDGAGATIGVVTLATGDLNDFPAVMTLANENVGIGDILHITVATANSSEITFICMATNGGQSVATTNLT